MSAIPNDAADIPTARPHPTGAATVINCNSVTSHSATTTSPTDSASTSPSSPSSPSASTSRLESRNLSLEQHQAEYRAHAFLANESIVATKLAADKFLQNLFNTRNEPDQDILRAASSASRARLQNPFTYNNAGSTGSSGTSGSSGSSSNPSNSSGPSYPRTASTPSAPVAAKPHTTAPAQSPPLAASSPATNTATNLAAVEAPLTEADFTDCINLEDAINSSASAQPNPIEIVPAPAPEASSELVIWPFGNLAISPPPPPCLNLATWPLNGLTISPCSTAWPHGP